MKYTCSILTILEFFQANKAAQKNTGYNLEELKSMTPVDLKPNFTMESFKELIAPIKTGEKEKIVFETLHQRKDKTIYNVEVHLQLLRYKNGALFAAIILDITERNRAEQEKEKLQAQLQQSKKMEAIGTLAGGIAHDFNNLLQAINGYTQLLLMDKNENDTEFRDLNAILHAGERAANLVRQLLLFSRKTEMERKPIHLNQVVEQAQMLLERTIPKMIDIEVRLGSRLWPVMADPVQIEQILLNLGTNAVDAMPDGGKSGNRDYEFCDGRGLPEYSFRSQTWSLCPVDRLGYRSRYG